MVVLSYQKRVKIINIFLNHTLYCPPKSLIEIIISWGSNETKIIDQIVHNYTSIALKNNIYLRYSVHDDKNLSRRFLDANDILTSTLFSIDDDILMTPEIVEYGYEISKKHPNQLVGYTGRYITFQKVNNSENKEVLKYEVPGNLNRIRLILTDVAFMSRELALAFYDKLNEKNLNFVRSVNNCEDILMNFVAMNYSNMSAVYIHKTYNHIGIEGLSATFRNTHFIIRDICVNKFYESFGRYPPIIPSNCKYGC